MSHELRELKQYPVRRLDGMPKALLGVAAVFVLLGLVVLGMGLTGDAEGVERLWRSYLFNWVYFTGIAQGAVVLGVIVTIAKGVWSRPLRRVALGFVVFLPLAYLILFPPILFWGAGHIFPWIEYLPPLIEGKEAYLNMPFLTARSLLLVVALLGVSLMFAYWAIRPDAMRAREAGFGSFSRLTRNWRGQAEEEARAHRKLSVLAPVLGMMYAVTWTFLAWDLIMSLDPHWFSTLFGAYVFMGAFLGGLALTAIFTVFYRRRLGLHEYVETTNLHDLGKLMFGFTVFWAYLFWAQYIVIWYGNIPWEQLFFVIRLDEPYRLITIGVFFMMFIIPFFGLLGATSKRTPALLATFSAVILFGLWVERYILVYPTLYPDELHFGLPEIGMTLGFLGLFLICALWFASRFPILQVWQPASEVELLGVEMPREGRIGSTAERTAP